MIDRLKKVLLAIAAVAALAFGGSAIAQAGNGAGPPATGSATESTQGGSESSGPDTDNIQDPKGPDNAQEKGSAEGNETSGNDGPGGHADEPGNPNADHQNQGKE